MPALDFRQHRSATRQHLHLASRDSSDVLNHATSEIASGSKLGIDRGEKLPGEGFKRPWPPLIKMDETVAKGGKVVQLVAADVSPLKLLLSAFLVAREVDRTDDGSWEDEVRANSRRLLRIHRVSLSFFNPVASNSR